MKAMEARSRVALQNILFTTDFSPVAENAALYALEFARSYNAKVHALHVRPIEIYGAAPPESWPILREATKILAEQQAAQLDVRFAGVEHDATVAEGNIPDCVEDYIEKDHTDLVVMGTHGRRGVEKVLLGSVTESVLRRAKCPVLTVGPNVRVSPKRAVTMKHILLAASFSPASDATAAYAVSLAQENQALLDIVHVIKPQKIGEVVHPSDLAAGCLGRMRSFVSPEADLWCESHVLVEVGDPAEQILNVAKARRADLIVLGVKSSDAFLGAAHVPWATAHKIIARAECPVITLRE